MDVPLCRMISLQVVRPALAMDIEKMKADFIHGYRPGAIVFYVSTTNIQGTEQSVSDEDHMSWNAHWRRKNVEFEEFLNADPELRFLSNKMFYVYDGNHKLVAWTKFIHQAYPNDLEWHFCVRTIVLRTLDNVTNVLTAMHDINRATKNSHMKTNLVHTLHRMQKVGTLPVDEFKSILSTKEIQAAKNALLSNKENKPWYNIPRAKFLEYIHSISNQSPLLNITALSVYLIWTHVRILYSKILRRLGTRRRESSRTSTTNPAGRRPACKGPSSLPWRQSRSSLTLLSPNSLHCESPQRSEFLN